MARARTTRRKRGGDGKTTRSVKLTSTSNQTYGYEHGTNPRDNAVQYQNASNASQNSKNKTLGSTGGSRRRRRGGSRRRRRGGTGCRPTKTTVTQFSTPGPAVSPVDASSTSTNANSTSLNAGVAATNDCHATNSCGPPPPTKPCPSGGARNKGTKRKYSRRRKAGSKARKTKWGCLSGGRRGSSKRRRASKGRAHSRRTRRR